MMAGDWHAFPQIQVALQFWPMAEHPSGPCARAGCDVPAGHGPKNALCTSHAAASAASAAKIIRAAAPDAMVMHQGPPAALNCGHTVSAGDHVVSLGARWVCEACALAG
jgi:hypothetical protein